MQNKLQIPLDKNTSTYRNSQWLQFRFDKDDISRLRLEKLEVEESLSHSLATMSIAAEVLIDLIRQAQVREFKVDVEPSGWFDVPLTVIWGFSSLEETPPPEEILPDIELFEREREAFLRIKNDLLEREEHLGEFVAIRNGQIVGYDRDIVELAHRVYAQYGYVSIYIDKVEREREVVELPSPEG